MTLTETILEHFYPLACRAADAQRRYNGAKAQWIKLDDIEVKDETASAVEALAATFRGAMGQEQEVFDELHRCIKALQASLGTMSYPYAGYKATAEANMDLLVSWLGMSHAFDLDWSRLAGAWVPGPHGSADVCLVEKS